MGKYSKTAPSKWSRHSPPPNQGWKICSSHCTKAMLKSLCYHHLSWPYYTFWTSGFWKGSLPVLDVAVQGAAGCNEVSSLSPSSSFLSLLPPPAYLRLPLPLSPGTHTHTHKVFLYGIGMLCSCRSLGCPCRAWKWKGRSGMSTLLEWSS